MKLKTLTNALHQFFQMHTQYIDTLLTTTIAENLKLSQFTNSPVQPSKNNKTRQINFLRTKIYFLKTVPNATTVTYKTIGVYEIPCVKLHKTTKHIL